MGVNLVKGQKVDLTKNDASISKLMVGLGWDPIEMPKKGGFLGGIFGGAKTPDIDCDASVLMLDSEGRLTDKDRIIYFGNLKSRDGSIMHSGDNLTGEGDGDDEVIMVDLKMVPQEINKLVFVVNIYQSRERNQHFGMIRNAFIRIVNNANRTELLKYNLTDDYSGKTSLIVGEIYRYNGDWKFVAVGEGTQDPGLGELIKRYV